MSDFDDDLAEAFADLLVEAGRTITYAGTEITALVEIGEAPRRSFGGTGQRGSQADLATIQVLKTDVAAPLHRDSVVIDGVTWRVDRVIGSNATRSVIALFTDERPRR